jgi:hypothetical protein
VPLRRVEPVREDPPIRTDGRCVVCGGVRGRLPKQVTQRAKAILKRELAGDPFCSTVCARKWHRTTLDGQASKAPPADLEWSHA